jgi:FixJ family two-component response regulator
MHRYRPGGILAQTTVLIVDDDEAVRDSLKLLLEMNGCEVQDFASGAELLAALPGDAGCLVLDYHMPGLNGLDLLEAVRARDLTVPAILITGLGDPRIRRRAGEAGVIEVLDKPFDDTALLAAVDRALGAEPA